MRAAIVQLYCTYSLYYPVLRVSSDLCAVCLYYSAAPTQILRALAAPMQLVPTHDTSDLSIQLMITMS